MQCGEVHRTDSDRGEQRRWLKGKGLRSRPAASFSEEWGRPERGGPAEREGEGRRGQGGARRAKMIDFFGDVERRIEEEEQKEEERELSERPLEAAVAQSVVGKRHK